MSSHAAGVAGVGQDPSRRLAFHLIVLVVLLICANMGVTQYLAHLFDFHANLGKPLAGKWYAPWQWVVWSFRYYDGYASVFDQAYLLVASVSILAFGGYAIVVAAWVRRSVTHDHLHGSAHWASPDEIRATGLLPTKRRPGRGVYIGGWQDSRGRLHYLRHDGPEHVLAFAPTRSGKGVGLVIPTLLSWPHSVVVLDIKGENWHLTSGWRSEKAANRVLKFDPTATDGSSVRFNPLDEIRLDTEHAVADVQNIVTMIVDPDGKGLSDHWAKTGHALLVGAVLHLLFKSKRVKGPPATLRGVADLLSDPQRPIKAVLEEMLEFKHQRGEPHPVVAACARDMLNKADQERSGVLSTAMSFLTLYRDPIVAKNTCVSEFSIRELMHHESPTSLYLVVRPSDKDRLKPLVRLMINQIVRGLTESMDFGGDGQGSKTTESRAATESAKATKHRLLLLIDEFPSLGRLDVFQESLAFIAGYGIKAYLIVQDLTQLYAAYGKDESILSNCHLRVAFAPNKVETAELLSKMTGITTVSKRVISTSGSRFGLMLGHASSSIHEVQRPLLTTDECMRLPGPRKDAKGDDKGNIVEAGDMLVFAAGQAPIYGRQILYFKDPVFSERASMKPRTSKLERKPTSPNQPAPQGAIPSSLPPLNFGSSQELAS